MNPDVVDGNRDPAGPGHAVGGAGREAVSRRPAASWSRSTGSCGRCSTAACCCRRPGSASFSRRTSSGWAPRSWRLRSGSRPRSVSCTSSGARCPSPGRRRPARHLAVDYVLLLGVLLLASDLAYVETQFRWLGPRLAAASPLRLAAVSRRRLPLRLAGVLSLALSTFAAWRGVSAALPSPPSREAPHRGVRRERARLRRSSSSRAASSRCACGARRTSSGVWTTLGLAPASRRALSGVFSGTGSAWVLWEAALFLCAGVIVAAASASAARSTSRSASSPRIWERFACSQTRSSGSSLAFTIAVSSLAVLAFLIRAQTADEGDGVRRRLGGRRPESAEVRHVARAWRDADAIDAPTPEGDRGRLSRARPALVDRPGRC